MGIVFISPELLWYGSPLIRILNNGFVKSSSEIFQMFPIHWSHFRVNASVIILPPSLFDWPQQLEWRNTPQNLMYLDTCDLKLHLRERIVSILHFNKSIRCQLPSCVFKSFSKKASSNSKVRSCKKVNAVSNAVAFGMIKKRALGFFVPNQLKIKHMAQKSLERRREKCNNRF